MTYVPWEQAWQSALYGDGGFFHRPEGPERTLPHRGDVRGVCGRNHRLAAGVDRVLGHPGDFTFVDVGAGRGELLGLLAERVPDRWRLLAVEVAARPPGLADRIGWAAKLGSPVTGVVLAHELLDAVPCVIAQCRSDGAPAVVLVEPATGRETLGDRSTRRRDLACGLVADGRARTAGGDRSAARHGMGRPVGAAATGLVLAVDYDHSREQRALLRHGTLAAYREGRSVPPVPDGTCDLTAHVAFDACAAVTPAAAGPDSSDRPRLSVARRDVHAADTAQTSDDPQAYASRTCEAAESRLLLDPSAQAASPG